MKRFVQLCQKCRHQRDANRLWNWADHQRNADDYWAVMTAVIPWAFRDPSNSNSIRLTW